ncbi:rhomboid-related protein 4 [Dermacentor silvarum]|uniref:rhomboid-related protein 4 n=1 Tax=Dermacentor silvarum TaxID=543639 RepID=UPI0018985FF5|nr:rhomboid-related protein 4 [Dermacentor silvarum]
MQQKRTREASGAFLLLFHALVSVGLDAIPPATFLITFSQVCVYLRLFSLPWSDVEDVCIGVDGVLFKGEWWRIFYGAIEHMDSMHLYYNMVSFVWKGMILEDIVGTVQFVWIIFQLTTLTGVLIVGLYYLLGIYADPIFYKHCGIGFSGVIFALKVLNNVKYPGQSRNILGVQVTLPSGFIVWFEPLLVQLITGNGSFVGHFAGVLAGLVYVGLIRPIFDLLWLVW